MIKEFELIKESLSNIARYQMRMKYINVDYNSNYTS